MVSRRAAEQQGLVEGGRLIFLAWLGVFYFLIMIEMELSEGVRDLPVRVGLLVEGIRERVWREDRKLSFGDWCEGNVVLSNSENSDYAGPYSREMTPSVCRFFEEFLDAEEGERWKSCYGMKGSQAAVTFHALVALAKRVKEAPGNIVYGIDAKGNAEAVAARFVEILKGIPAMDSVLEGVGENDLKGDTVKLPGMTCWFVGAGSVGAMASKPGVIFVCLDELDLHRAPKREGSTRRLLESRGKATKSGKILGFSKPSDEDGQTAMAVAEGSGHRDFVPCPRCGEFQWLKMKQVRYEHCRDESGEYDLERVLREAFYECESCGGKILEEEKKGMLQLGEVRPTHFVEKKSGEGETVLMPGWKPKAMSFYHSDLYALWDGSTWGNLALEKIEAGKNPTKLKGFVQDRLGEPWRETGARRVQVDELRTMCGEYRRGDLPLEPVVCGVFADTQDDCWKGVKVGFSRAGDVMVSDWGIFLTWENLVRWAKGGMVWEGQRKRVLCNLTDEGGHRTYEVRRRCRALAPIFNPSKGLGGMQNLRHGGDLLRWNKYRAFKTDKEGRQTVNVLNYDDDAYRRMLYRDLILDRNAVDDDGEPIERFGELMFPVDAAKDEDFLEELTKEFQVRKNGKWVWETDGMNDFGDAVKLAVIGRDVFARKFMKG